MIYDIYHDESKEDAFWHHFLFIPRETRQVVLDYLKRAKQASGFRGKKLSFKDLQSNPSFECARSWLSILSAALQQKNKGRLEYFLVGKLEYSKTLLRPVHLYERFPYPPRCKTAIFVQSCKHADMIGHFDNLSKIETTFRMGLQGACHYLFDQTSPLEIGNIFLDREMHYYIEHKRDFDRDKVLSRLDARLREYCSLSPSCEISGENIVEGDRIFLDLADVFLGALRLGVRRPTRRTCNTDKERRKHNLCGYIAPLVERLAEGDARMRHSRFRRFGTFSSAWIEAESGALRISPASF